MRFLLALLLAATAAGPASAQIAPTQFYGQYVPTAASTSLPTSNGATAARDQFLADLTEISFFGFENETVTYTATTGRPARNATNPLVQMATARFDGYGSRAEIPARIWARSAEIVQPTNRTPNAIDGTWATGGSKYLYAVGYDGINANVALPAGQTQTALSIRYDPSAVTPGSTPRPFSAFGGYIIDTEAYDKIRLTLTPFGGGTAVVLDYPTGTGQVTNDNAGTDDPRGDFPGNYQVSFVGFSDPDSQYERIDISFVGRGNTPTNVDNEAFGFDDFVVGEVNQVSGPTQTVQTGPVADEPGWRLLSTPYKGITIDDLAQQNLVQGVAAGTGTAAQYPAAGSNFYTAYGGGTRWDYTPAAATDQILRPGRGFWWYWYDRDITPNPAGQGGGTSVSVVLDNFQLSGSGPELLATFSEDFEENDDCASDPAQDPAGGCVSGTRNGAPPPSTETPTGTQVPRQSFTPADDDFYMVGNPFPQPMLASGISATGGTLQDVFFIWNPGNQSGDRPRTGEDVAFDGPGSYELVYQTPLSGQQAAIAVWNGALVEVSNPTTPGDTVRFTYDRAATVGAGAPPFHGKTTDSFAAFELVGETVGGAKTRDAAAAVRFRRDAETGWDRYDASKPVGPVAVRALIAPVGERDGEPNRQSVVSLPDVRPLTLAFEASDAGDYTLTWQHGGFDGVLVDLATGAETPLAAGRYSFRAEGTLWTERFKLYPNPAVSSEGGPGDARVSQPMPNPATDQFRLTVRPQDGSELRVRVVDALGRTVAEARETAAPGVERSVRVGTASLAAGFYTVVVEAEGLRETRRLTVVR